MNKQTTSLLGLTSLAAITILSIASPVNASELHRTEGVFEYMVIGLPQTFTGSYFFEDSDGAGEISFTGILPAGMDTFEIQNGEKNVLGFDLDGTLFGVSFDFVQFSPVPNFEEVVQSVTLATITEDQLTSIFPVDVNILGIGPVRIKTASAEWVPVPEPLTILGSATALSFGAFFKRKLKASKTAEKVG